MRYSASVLRPLIEQLDGVRASWLPGYRVKIIDGNCIEASERRLKALRQVQGGALPGKSLVVYEPAHGLVSEVFLCEDGHAQERSMLAPVLETVQADDLWIQDRNFHIPSDLVVDQWASDGERSSHRGFLFLHDV